MSKLVVSKGGHWVNVERCVGAGRCFHLERVEWMLRASSNQAGTIVCLVKREAYVESFLRKAVREEGFASECPVYREVEISSVSPVRETSGWSWYGECCSEECLELGSETCNNWREPSGGE